MGANQWRFNEALSNVGNFWANQILTQNERDRIEAEKQKQLAFQQKRNELAQRVINKGAFNQTTEPTPIDVPDNLGIYTPKQEQTDFMPLAPNKTVQTPQPQTPNVPFKQAQTYQTYNKFAPDDQRATNTYAMQLASMDGGAEQFNAYNTIQKVLNPTKKNVSSKYDQYQIFQNDDGSREQSAIPNPQWKPESFKVSNEPKWDEQAKTYMIHEGYPDANGKYELGGTKYKITKSYEQLPKGTPIDRMYVGKSLKSVEGYRNPAADPKAKNTRVVNGELYTITDYKTIGDIGSGEGNANDLPKDTKQLANDYLAKAQGLKRTIDAINTTGQTAYKMKTINDKQDYELDKNGQKIPTTKILQFQDKNGKPQTKYANLYENEYNSVLKEFDDLARNTLKAHPKAEAKWVEIYNESKQRLGTLPSAQDAFDEGVISYKKGELNAAEFQAYITRLRATYLHDFKEQKINRN